MSTHSTPSRSTAFTLVELLVVIAIVGVLMAMLLPSMGKAKESGRRAVCMSNLHQLSVALNLYADAHKESLLIGYVVGTKQFNYMIYYNSGSAGNTRPLGLGLLVPEKTIVKPNAFYCPTSFIQFNQTFNPAPVWPIPLNDPVGGTRCSYGTRPSDPWTGPSPSWVMQPWPNRDRYAENALIADSLSTDASLSFGHVDGANTLYGNGSVHFVRAAEINAGGLAQIPNVGFTSIYDSKMDTLWTALDKN